MIWEKFNKCPLPPKLSTTSVSCPKFKISALGANSKISSTHLHNWLLFNWANLGGLVSSCNTKLIVGAENHFVINSVEMCIEQAFLPLMQ